MTIEPYLFFNGRCAEAVAYYRQVFDAQVPALMRFSEAPASTDEGCAGAPIPEGWGDKVMHGEMTFAGGRIMVSDGMGPDDTGFRGFSLAVPAADEAQNRQRFDALSQGGKVVMPMGATFFSPCFGVVEDRYGVQWMLIVPQEGR